MTNRVNQLYEDFLDNITLQDANNRKTASDVLPQTEYAGAFELMEHYDYLFSIRAQVLNKTDVSRSIKIARAYLDEILTMNRMVDEYEVGFIYKTTDIWDAFGIDDPENGVASITDDVAEVTGASRITKEERLYFCIGITLKKEKKVKGLIRLLHSLNLKNTHKERGFIMCELTIVMTDHKRTIPDEDYIVRYLSEGHISDFINDKYSDTGDHFFQILCFRDVMKALFLLAPDMKQKTFETLKAMRPKSYEFLAKKTTSEEANSAYQQKICTSTVIDYIKKNHKVSLKKSVMDTLTQTELSGTYIHDALIYWECLENAAEWNIEYLEQAHTSVAKEFAKFIQSGEAYAQYAEMRAIKSKVDFATLCLYLKPQFIHNRFYEGVIVLPGAETEFFYSFHQYAEQLKKCFNDKLDDIYLTNAIAKALK